jgi:hypothetical protein
MRSEQAISLLEIFIALPGQQEEQRWKKNRTQKQITHVH